MQGNVCMVTGANSGIGKVTALELAKQGATVVMVCRNAEKGRAAQAEIKAQSGNEQVDLLLADFAVLQQVRELADTFRQKYQRLDRLVNNAGLFLNKRQESADGYEYTFAVNHLAPFLLTNLLLDMLKASAPARVVTVASEAERGARLDFDDLQLRQGFNGMRAYSNSKLANILFTYALARRLEGSGVTANCMHPGGVATNFAQNTWFGFVFKLFSPFLRSPEEGAATLVYLASSPEVADVNGTYFKDKQPIRAAPIAYDEAVQERLWQVSAELVDLSTAPAPAHTLQSHPESARA